MAEQKRPESDPVPVGVDLARGVELYVAPQRPTDAQGPEQHISMFGAEVHGHPDTCCCWASCKEPACDVPGVGR